MFTSHPDTVNQILDLTIEMVMFRSFGVMDSIFDDQGSFWSDESVTGGDLIGFYNDLVEHEESFPVPTGIDEETGEPIIEQIPMPVRILDQLRIVAPHHAEELDRQYNREVAKLLESA